MTVTKRLCLAAIILAPPLLAGCGPRESDDDARISLAAKAMAGSELGSLKPGMWESHLTVGEIKLPSIAANRKGKIISRIEKDGAHQSCVDEAQAKVPPPSLFAGNAQDCRYSNFTIAGGEADIALSCEMASVGTVDMKLTGPIAADSYSFDADIALRLPMIGKVPVKAKLIGKYKGGCETRK